jgi:hypothetical protein
VAEVPDPHQPGHVLRQAHFRILDAHKDTCRTKFDPHGHKERTQFRKALMRGDDILIELQFDTDFPGLQGRANILSQNEIGKDGLWERDLWHYSRPPKKQHASRAQDVDDVLYYLQMADQLRGKRGLQQLYFASVDAVQSFNRFVVTSDAQYAQIEKDLIGIAEMTPHNFNPKLWDTPHLFLYRASSGTINDAITDKKGTVFGQRVSVDTPTRHDVVLGLELSQPLNNQIVLAQEGPRISVIASPHITRSKAKTLLAMRNDPKLKRDDVVVWMMLGIKEDTQLIRAPRSPEPAPSTQQKLRQLELAL